MLKSYLKKIYEIADRGDAREESFYSTLEGLLRQYTESVGKRDVDITPQPKKTEAGNPDFRVWDGKQHITGYIEAKAPTVVHLDQIEDTEQLRRYLHTFPNVILTNFFEFRLYRKGTLIDKVTVARPFVVHKLKTIPPVEKESDFLRLLDKFFSFSLPRVYDARTLAIELAKRTRFLKDEVVAEELRTVGQTFLSDKCNERTSKIDQTFLSDDKENDNKKRQTGMSVLHGFYEAFRGYLISGLSKEDFADLYSQTITYGLFAARIRSENGFNRKLAYDRIPHTIGILREVFRFISLEDLPPQMEWIIDDTSEVLAVTDVKKILHKYFYEGKGKDPIVHFYETFLAEYDPQTREKRGVYYTPEPVVSYIVRSLHNILKDHFNRIDGFASDTVTVLDPAAGTLTFLAEAAKLAAEEFVCKYGKGGKKNLIEDHILKNFYAFELMMAPYAVGHLKMSFLLEELGYKLQKDDRFKLYLTNTLEMEELAQTELPGMASLSEESHLAGKVKKEQPILVILGNPPYSGHSVNVNPWINRLLKEDTDGLQSYYKVDGKPLGEKNPKWLQDDYVKFIRFAQWKIEQAGEGALGFITNHSYLDNPTFRGMRQSLMNTFNEIYILNLHGNSLKKEKCPDGSKDENVFDIRQGVAIALFIKKKMVGQTFLSDNNRDRTDKNVCSGGEEGVGQTFLSDKGKDKRTDKNVCSTGCKVYYSELWGLRNEKYDLLLKNDLKTSKWEDLNPTSPFYFFVPREEKGRDVYEKYWKVTDIFPVNVTGIVTARDHFVIDFSKEALKRRIAMFRNPSMPDDLIKQTFRLKDTRGWKLTEARKELAKDENWDRYFTRIFYRPFDVREIYYTPKMVDWGRPEVMRHMMQDNLGLVTCRQISSDNWQHALVTTEITDDSMVSNRTRERGYIFPLYLYPDIAKKDLFSHKKKAEKSQPNINPKLLECLSKIYGQQVGQTFLSDLHEETGADGLIIKRRKLPHWTLGGATYFVTFRTLQRELSVDEQKIVLEHVREGEGKFYELIAVVVMPDHAHVLLTPLKGYSLSRIMKGIKGVSAHKINQLRGTKGKVWQDESFDRIIRDQKELDEKLNYMLNNPLKKDLTDDPWNYHGWYFNEKYNEAVDQTFLSDHEDKQECLSYQIFCYIYAILYSNIYRKKYAEFLKIDFPKVPFTKDYKLFSQMAEYGKKLVDLHLLKSPELASPVAKFEGKGDNMVQKLKYEESPSPLSPSLKGGETFLSPRGRGLGRGGKLYINKDQYFDGIPSEVWQYQIGGYQVCNKWLKDRKGRKLSLDDIKHYCKIATALQKTIEIQRSIDHIYPEVEKRIIDIRNNKKM